MLWPVELLVDGASVPLAGVLADCTIRHGRDDVAADPQASTIQLTLLGLTHAQTTAFRMNAAVILNCRDGAGPVLPRFTGRVTDATLDDDRMTLIAVGRLATFGRYTIGATAWPEETWTERVLRIFTEAGLAPPNRITNGGFETDTAGWVNGSATITRDTTQAKFGSASGRFVAPGATANEYIYTDIAAPTAGEPMDISLWVKGPAGAKLYAYLEYPSHYFTATGDWQQITFRRPSTGAVRVYFATDERVAAQAVTVYLDGVRVTQGDSPLVFQPDPAFDPVLVGRDPATAGETTLGDYLAFLAPMVGAAVCDLPDGRVLVQALGARQLTTPTVLDPAIVAYVPAWYQDLPHGNVVTVRYTGDQSEQVTVSDSGSVAAYGAEFPATIDTTFKNAADATTRANERLARSAYSHWNMPQAPLLEPRTLRIGVPVWVSLFPDASPYDPWTPILEGWTDQISGNTWTMELALSDPLASGIAPLTWSEVGSGDKWNTINQTVMWKDALTPASIAP